MLILSRKAGERIFIGNSVTVTILMVSANRLRIGIDAPSEIPIRRSVVAGHPSNPMDVNSQPDATRAS